MSPDNNRSDDYWMGVRDALRMVDSFIRWSSVNEGRAKPIEEFIHDGLIAAAKRCESCLHKELGVDFDREDEIDDQMDETINDYEEYEEDEPVEFVPPEIILEPEGSDESEDVTITIEPDSSEDSVGPHIDISTDDKSVHIESMGIKEGSVDDDTQVTGDKRDFSTDFRLVEPDPLVIEDSSAPVVDTISPEEEDTSESSDTSPSESDQDMTADDIITSWEDSHRPTPEESKDSVSTSPETDSGGTKKIWSPLDEPSIEDSEEEIDDEVDSDGNPPPPPPPPETEESEEERRRRARRLFFGG
jgi:hypothetical protein